MTAWATSSSTWSILASWRQAGSSERSAPPLLQLRRSPCRRRSLVEVRKALHAREEPPPQTCIAWVARSPCRLPPRVHSKLRLPRRRCRQTHRCKFESRRNSPPPQNPGGSATFTKPQSELFQGAAAPRNPRRNETLMANSARTIARRRRDGTSAVLRTMLPLCASTRFPAPSIFHQGFPRRK